MTPEQRKHFEYVRDVMHGDTEPVDRRLVMKNLLNLIIDAAKNDDMQRVIELAEKQQDKFCDNNCVWTDHHPDCKLGQPNRHELQAKGEHPAPCARFCEANAFQIEIRGLKAKLAQQQPEWYHTKNIYGCDVFYHRSEERGYMSGKITPLYTTPPQRTWVGLTDEQIKEASLKAGMQEHYMGFHSGFICFAREVESKLKEKNT